MYTLNLSWNLLDSPEFPPTWKEMVKNTADITKRTKQFPWLFSVFKSLPEWFVKVLNPDLMLVLNMQEVLLSRICFLKRH